jgi:hypothetical protein
MRGMAALFLLKAILLALFITPLWDVPDETGHYAIVEDLADGKGLPLQGRSVLPADVSVDWAKGRALSVEERWNWVAQHPPLYHLLAVPFLQAARKLSSDPHWHYRAPRLLSALSGAAGLLVFFTVFREASGDAIFAFVAASAVGFLPMYSHMSSGTNHDVFLAFLCGLAALYGVRLARSGRFADGMKMGAALAAAGVTKLSALVLAAALLALAWRWLAAPVRRRIVEWVAIGAISFSLAALWTLRHLVLLGNARLHPVSKKAFDLGSFLSYLHDYPVVDHTFKNFVGLIGWTGTGAGNVRWFQISGVFLAPYFAIALAATAVTGVWLWKTDPSDTRWRLIGRAAAVLLLLFGVLWLFAGSDGSAPAKRGLYSLLAAVPLLALSRLRRRERGPGELLCASHAVFLLFAVAYLINSWEGYEIYGGMRATNGRYFFALIPFLGLAFLMPAARLWKSGRTSNRIFLALLALLVLDETAFFLARVIPFYRGA